MYYFDETFSLTCPSLHLDEQVPGTELTRVNPVKTKIKLKTDVSIPFPTKEAEITS
jgi:hypothetical protein